MFVARVAKRLPENAPGAFFVDDSCIDCDACRQLAPAVFARSPRLGQSYVAAQPGSASAESRALMAVVACPTASIGTSPKCTVGAATAAFPERLEDDVYYCGWHAEASYGAASYLIVRPRLRFQWVLPGHGRRFRAASAAAMRAALDETIARLANKRAR